MFPRDRPLLVALLISVGAAQTQAAPVRYNRDIRPVLSDNCFACHGPDKGNRKAGLRLEVREEAIKPAGSGETALVPGTPEKSALIARIESREKDEVMPPPKAHKTVTQEQRALLRQWIAEGAPFICLGRFREALPPRRSHFKVGHSNFAEVAPDHRCWRGSLYDFGGFSAPKQSAPELPGLAYGRAAR